METIWQGFAQAFSLIVNLDDELASIILLSLKVTLSAVAIASLIGFALGAWLAMSNNPLKHITIVSLNALMGLPPVVVGLALYILLSNSGPFGALNLLFTPSAMVLAQTIIILPIIASISHKTLENLWLTYRELLLSLRMTKSQSLRTLIWEGRRQLMVAGLAGFGRAIGEVGAVMIVGGNIEQVTRVLTTAITLETSRGDIEMALALGIILVSLAFISNFLAHLALYEKGSKTWH